VWRSWRVSTKRLGARITCQLMSIDCEFKSLCTIPCPINYIACTKQQDLAQLMQFTCQNNSTGRRVPLNLSNYLTYFQLCEFIENKFVFLKSNDYSSSNTSMTGKSPASTLLGLENTPYLFPQVKYFFPCTLHNHHSSDCRSSRLCV